MKRICIITTIPSTIESFFIPQLRYLSQNGFDVTVITSPSDRLKLRLGNEIKYVSVNMPRGISILGSIKAIIELSEILKKEQFDIIQYSTPNAAFYSSIAAKFRRIKIRNYHIMGFRYLSEHGMKRIILKTIEKISCLNSTSIECISKSNMVLGIKEKIFPKEKASIVWNGSTGGVDLLRFDFSKRELWRKKIRDELNISERSFVYGFAGRITGDKGINELLRAYLNLSTEDKLLIVGGIENEKTLNKELLRMSYNCKNIIFCDRVQNIEEYFAAMDVLVLPSYREGFGNVVIEAGAVGTPAIVSNIPGPIDAIDEGVTALTVAVKDVSDLENKMHMIREMDYKAMGENASRFVKEKFDSEILCEKILERKVFLLGKKEELFSSNNLR